MSEWWDWCLWLWQTQSWWGWWCRAECDFPSTHSSYLALPPSSKPHPKTWSMTKYLHHHFSRHPNVNTNTLKWTNIRYGKSSDTHPPLPPPPRKKMPITIWKRVPHTIRASIYLHAPIRIMPKYTRHFSKRGFPPWLVGWWWWGRAGNCSDKANLPYKEVKSNRPLLMSSSFWSLSVAVLLQLGTNYVIMTKRILIVNFH